MKHNKLIAEQTRAAMAVALLACSPLAMAANYDFLNQQQNSFGNLDQGAPLTNESWGSPSILDSLQQEKINEKKRDYQAVLILLKENKLKEAETKLASLMTKFPNDAEIYNLKALFQTLNKDIAAAEQSYQKAISLDKNNMLAHLGLSKLALDAGNLTQAKDYADKALAINNKMINAYLLLADIAYKQKNNNEVEALLSTAHEKVKGDIAAEIEVIKNLGKFYAVQKQPEKLLPLGEDLVKRYPDDSKALSVLAGAQIVNNQKPAAEETLTKLINKEKQDIEHRLLLAKLLSEHADKEKEVVKLLDEALAIAPDKPQAYVFKTAFEIKLKHYAEALELANLTEKQFPDLFIGKLLKGDVYLAQQKLDKALDNYRQAYQKQPNNKVLFTISDILNAQKKTPDAIKLLDGELAKSSKNSAIRFKLATLYQQQKDYPQAETHYKAMLNDQPDNVLALNNLAWIYSQSNHPQALEIAKKAYDKAPDSAAIADTYGYILLKQGQPQEALKILEKAATLAPKANDILFHQAEAHVANNQQTKAIEILERIVKVEQDFSEKKAAVDLLNKVKKK